MRTIMILTVLVVCTATLYAQEPTFQWRTTGPFGGGITSVAGTDSFLLAGTVNAQIWRRQQQPANQGTIWSPSNTGIGNKYIENGAYQIALTASSQIAVVGANIYDINEGKRSGQSIYRSINQGQLWLPVTFANIDYNSVSFLTASEDLVLATTRLDIGAGCEQCGPFSWLSRDYGVTWQRISNETTIGKRLPTYFIHPWFVPSMVQLGQTVLIAEGLRGLLRSVDRLQTWTTATIGLPAFIKDDAPISTNLPVAHSLCRIDTNVFMVADTTVYGSNDSGKTWNATGFQMPRLQQSPFPSIINNLVAVGTTLIASVIPAYYQDDEVQHLKDVYSKRLSLEGILMRSDDKGKTWRTISLGAIPYKVANRLTVPVGNDLYYLPVDVAVPASVYPNAGLWRSRNKGDTWESLNDSIPSYVTNKLLRTSDNKIFTITTAGRIFTKSSVEKSWERVIPKSIFNGYSGGTRYLVVGNALFAASYGRLFRSDDAAVTWKEQPTGFSIQGDAQSALQYANGRMFSWSADTVFQSSDTGRTWGLLKQLGSRPYESIRNLVVDSSAQTIYVEFSDRLVTSVDRGVTWTSLKWGDAQYQKASVQYKKVQSIAVGNVLLQLTNCCLREASVSYSRDSGTTWTNTNLGLPNRIRVLELKVFDNTIFAATSEGVYEAALINTSVRNQFTDNFISALTAPNPTADFTNISFTLPRATHTHLSLYSTLGTEVWRDEGGILPAGEQCLRIDTRGLPSGVYMYRLTAGGVSSVGRIVVVR
jgi:photosystem II stability/assembly factor-like uncharacterized protein